MLTELISQYLETHRRLNIPGVGAFMVKGDPHEVLFSELLKRDDGVLRTLLLDSGMRDIEAAAAVDRFVFELRHATELEGGEFVMEGFGVLRRVEGGKLHFEEYATPQLTSQPVIEKEQIEEVKPTQEESMSQQQTQEREVEESSERPKLTEQRIKELYASPKTFRERDSDIEDLTYSKRQKPLGGYTYVQNGGKKRGVDKMLLFGIIAALLALGVIAYGYYVGYMMGGDSLFGDNMEEVATSINVDATMTFHEDQKGVLE